MKKLFLLLLAIPLLSLTVATDNTKFVGKWVGEDNNDVGYMTFDSEGYASFEVQGQVMGGKEFEMNGQKGSMTYKINSETDPIEVDFVVTMQETGEEKKLLCIAKFIDDDTLEFAMDFLGSRPTDFDSGNSITFNREK